MAAAPTVRRLHLDHLHQPGGWRSPAWVEVDEAGFIAAVHGAEPIEWAHEEVVHLPGFAVPGMPNLHSHAFQRAMAGHGEARAPEGDDSFWSWRTGMYRLAERVGPDELEAIAAQLYVELLEAGYTSVGEFHYLHHAPDGRPYADPAELGLRIGAAARRTGLALTLLPVYYRHGGFGRPPEAGQRRFVHRDLDGYLALVARATEALAGDPTVRVGVAPHSLRAVAADELIALIRAVDPETRVHVHVAEQEDEVHAALAHLGARPVAWLLDHLELGPRWCLVHATHLDAAERRRLARSGAVAGLCPTTEANLGDGIFPAAAFVAEGGTFGVGSDSHAVVRAAEELRLLETGQRLVHRRRNVLAAPGDAVKRHTGRRLYDLALAGGAQALDQPAGALVPGRRADLVVLDPDHPRLVGHGPKTVLDAFVLAAGDGAVKDVLVAGRHLVREGRHLLRDEIRRAYATAVSHTHN